MGPSRPMVIELVGPAGVGKTTLALQLEGSGQGVRGTMWHVPRSELARGIIRQLRAVLTLYRETGKFLWDEIKHFARLEALRLSLSTPRWNRWRIVALDEGPVYTLSYLQVMGDRRFLSSPAPACWYHTLQTWSGNLDAVVVLDAPDEVLTTRVRTRPQWHLFKDRSADELSAFSHAYRRATERVLTDWQAMGGTMPKVVRLDVGDGGQNLADRVLEAVGQATYAR